MADEPKVPLTPGEAFLGMLKTWTAWVLLAFFLVLELVNFGVLPSVIGNLEAKIAFAEADTGDAKARVAKLRQQAEADVASADARAKAELAKHAKRKQDAGKYYESAGFDPHTPAVGRIRCCFHYASTARARKRSPLSS